jgi:hypothetical protein
LEIPNADQQTFTYSQSGNYQVGTTILGNCPTLSNEIVVQITGLEEIDIQITHQSTNRLVLQSNTNLTDPEFSWFDISGRIISTRSEVGIVSHIDLEIPSYAGIKLLRIESNETSKTLKIQ